MELEILNDEPLDLEQEQDTTFDFHTTIDTIDFKNITGNVEGNQTLVDYIDENGGKIDKISVNGTLQPIIQKQVDITTPTKTSELQNDSEFVNETQLATKQDLITANTEIDIKKVNFGDGTYVDKTTLQQTSNAIQSLNENKVDKVSGKGLSTNDFTNEEKQKLSELENYDDTEIKQDIQDIQSLIPSEASATNQLADKEYVDTHTPTLESFNLELDWSNGSKALGTFNGKLEDIG